MMNLWGGTGQIIQRYAIAPLAAWWNPEDWSESEEEEERSVNSKEEEMGIGNNNDGDNGDDGDENGKEKIDEHDTNNNNMVLQQHFAAGGSLEDIDDSIRMQLKQVESLLKTIEKEGTKRRSQFELQAKYQLARIEQSLEEKRLSQKNDCDGERLSLKTKVSRTHSEPKSYQSDELRVLFSRVRNGRYGEVEKMIQDGIPVDVRDEFGNTLLIIAAQNGRKRIVKLCLRYGADVNAQNYKLQTALHYCYAFNYRELAVYLVGKGADPTLRNEYHLTCTEGLGVATKAPAPPMECKISSDHQTVRPRSYSLPLMTQHQQLPSSSSSSSTTSDNDDDHGSNNSGSSDEWKLPQSRAPPTLSPF